jgi:hypothetical protein
MTTPAYYLSRTTGADLTPFVATLPYYVGAAIKYLFRAGRKPGVSAVDDLRKAAHCALLAVEHDPEGLDRATLDWSLWRPVDWCGSQDAVCGLWWDLLNGHPAAVRQSAHDLLRAIDAGEVTPCA